MPNWTENVLSVSGTPKQLKAFAKKMEYRQDDGSTTPLQFQSLIPMPEILSRINQGSGHAGDKVHASAWVTHEDGKASIFTPVDGAASQAIADICGGHSSWYEWSIANWGCKWDCRDVSVEDQGGCLVYRFETPWGPPATWYHEVVKAFPKLEFECEYRNEDDGYEETYHL
jgi:hypothetical protein